MRQFPIAKTETKIREREREILPRWSLEPHGVRDGGGSSGTWWSGVQNTEVSENLGLSAAECRAQEGSRDYMELRMPGTLERGI